MNYREWGRVLDLPAYLDRERFLSSTQLAVDDGITTSQEA